MYTKQELCDIEKRVEELTVAIKKMQKERAKLKGVLTSQKYYYKDKERRFSDNTSAFDRFNKPFRELNEEEMREYYTIRKRESRANKKEETENDI